MVLFIMLYKVVITFESVAENPKCACVTIQMKAVDQQYFLAPVVLFIHYAVQGGSLCMVFTFLSVDETPKSGHSNESY